MRIMPYRDSRLPCLATRLRPWRAWFRLTLEASRPRAARANLVCENWRPRESAACQRVDRLRPGDRQ